jgi:hypothetical protein
VELEIKPEIAVLEDLYRHAKMLRTSSKNPSLSKVAADWEEFFLKKLTEERARHPRK